MKYIKDDLDYIFIRAKLPNGRWGNLSLAKLPDKQFINWAEEKFDMEMRDASDVIGKPWTAQQKVDFLNNLNNMSKRIGQPCVVMIKREFRKK